MPNRRNHERLKTRAGRWLRFVSAPAVLLAAWEALALADYVNPLFFPPPSRLALEAVRMAASGELGAQIGATLHRTVAAFLAGSLAGLACGIVMGGFRWLHEALEPLIAAVYATPKLTLLPILMLILGVNEAARVAVPALSCFLLLAIHGFDAVRSIQKDYVELAKNYGLTRLMRLRRVYLPAAVPQVFTGIRLAFGQALVLTISVEIVSSDSGLGNMIWTAWQTFSTEQLYIGVFAAAALGIASLVGLRRLERKLAPWHEPHAEGIL